jgi:hypothetical protein
LQQWHPLLKLYAACAVAGSFLPGTIQSSYQDKPQSIWQLCAASQAGASPCKLVPELLLLLWPQSNLQPAACRYVAAGKSDRGVILSKKEAKTGLLQLCRLPAIQQSRGIRG